MGGRLCCARSAEAKRTAAANGERHALLVADGSQVGAGNTATQHGAACGVPSRSFPEGSPVSAALAGA
ncbi:MAG: hypothetical protein IPH08_19360 [Rhodocyclaceae bacterium]|nr:hypothetical protein [Rhodocyclaceae bacterium]MBK6909158.1 hypothetical protein [Rhodocyclaceae bacterium]